MPLGDLGEALEVAALFDRTAFALMNLSDDVQLEGIHLMAELTGSAKQAEAAGARS